MSIHPHESQTSVTGQVVLLAAIIALANLADMIHKSSRVYLYQQALCLVYYKTFDPSKIERYSHVEEALCKVSQIQSRLAILDGLDSFLSTLPRKPISMELSPDHVLHSQFKVIGLY